MNCKVCQNKTSLIISFGQMPIANGFSENLQQKEFTYHLCLAFCPSCLMVQLGETVPAEKLFNKNYPFFSSTSKTMMGHFEKMANEIIKKTSKRKKPFIVELGCNDGIMLKHFVKKKIDHLGIEPTANTAALARKKGIKVLTKFFDQKTAKEIVKTKSQADIICGANVFCHIENLNAAFKGISVLLKKNGLVFFEEPYLPDIIKKSSFDQIYDEHVYYFSGLSIKKLAAKHHLQLVDMIHQNTHGGSMRYYLKKGRKNRINLRVKKYLTEEEKINLHRLSGYLAFKNKVIKISKNLKNKLEKLKKQGKKIAAYGATSKSATLLNFAKIDRRLIDYVVDNTPAKIGKYTPKTHIPVRNRKYFLKDKPDLTLLLAWNHQKEIFNKEKNYRRQGGKFILFFPKIKII